LHHKKELWNFFIKIDKKNEIKNTCGCSLKKQDNNNIGESHNREKEVISDDNKFILKPMITKRKLRY